MKTLLIAGLALAVLSPVTFAQTTSGSESTSGANSTAHQANSQALTYAPTYNSPAQPTRTNERVNQNPDVVVGAYAPSMSSDSCMSTGQFGISAGGVGVTGGKGVPDASCRVLRVAEKHLQIVNAANVIGRSDVAQYQLMLAEIDACFAEGIATGQNYTVESCQKTAHDSVYSTKH